MRKNEHKNNERKIVPAHDQVRRLIELVHYPDHEKRTESEEFKRVRAKLHAQGARCFIDNGFCEGPIQIHHAVVEWAAANEVDWERVKRDHGFDHVDDIRNMMPLCAKHHQYTGFGIHNITYPAWILQKYMTRENLGLFEAAVKHLIEEEHHEHHINHAARKMLLHLGKAEKAKGE